MKDRHEKSLVVGCLVAIVGAALVYRGAMWRRQSVHREMCISNLKQIGLGTMQYVRDYDELYPRAPNWSDDLGPYTKNTALFLCPERRAALQGYAFHRGAAQRNLAMFRVASKTVIFFDSEGPKRNTCDEGDSLPRPARHFEKHGILFGDGHVEMVARPDFKFGYDAAFAQRQKEARVSSAIFWAAYTKKQRDIERRKIAQQKKTLAP